MTTQINHVELARFSANSKTFFFNKMIARNESEYLSINAIWGKGNKQRMTLFPSQLLEYHKALGVAIEKMTGMSAKAPEATTACPECGMPKRTWAALSCEEVWIIVCKDCGTVCDASIEDFEEAAKVWEMSNG